MLWNWTLRADEVRESLKIKTFKSLKEVMESFLNAKNFKSPKKMIESFFSIKNFKTVTESFFQY